jgi:hypothetical protein
MDNMRLSVSDYANDDAKEFAAEAFKLVMMGEKNKTATAFYEWYKKNGNRREFLE